MIKVKEFECDPNLSRFTDSLLFESEYDIAYMVAELENGNTCEVHLCVRGKIDIKLDSDDDYVCHPEDYSPELRAAIENKDYDKLDIESNNWFELLYSIKNLDDEVIESDGDMFEEDIASLTPDELKNVIIEHINNFTNNEDEDE